MLMIDSPITHAGDHFEYHPHKEELNRLLSAAVVSTSFRNLLLANPEIALASGYQGETFHLSDEDRNWLLSVRPSSLVDLAANLVVYQQETRQVTTVKLPAEPSPSYVTRTLKM
jgi:hypothetical protein